MIYLCLYIRYSHIHACMKVPIFFYRITYQLQRIEDRTNQIMKSNIVINKKNSLKHHNSHGSYFCLLFRITLTLQTIVVNEYAQENKQYIIGRYMNNIIMWLRQLYYSL